MVHFKLQLGTIAVLSVSLLAAFPARGQVVPDATLPVNSVVVPNGNTSVIEGGTVTGSNLFHSFSEFSVPTGSAAVFNNEAGINNILSRVTGNNISNIDGLVSANGNTNFFLLNPNGIVFGPNARLDLGGSFFATSAEAILFADGVEFSAANPEMTPLLTVSVPSGLQFGDAPGAIVNRSTVDRAEVIAPLDAIGLQVLPGNTLALVGGDVQFEGGAVSTGGGRIELGSVGNTQVVGIQPADGGLGLNYDGANSFGSVRLVGGAIVNSSGDRSGPIQIRANALEVDRSRITAFNFGDRTGGLIDIDATTVDFIGEGREFFDDRVRDVLRINDFTNLETLPFGLLAVSVGTGTGGSVELDAVRVDLRESIYFLTRSIGPGPAGDIRANVAEFLEINAAGVVSNTSLDSSSDSGQVTVNTRQIRLLNSGAIGSENFGSIGRSNTVTVNASESIDLVGVQLRVTEVGDGRTESGNSIVGTSTQGTQAGDVRVTTGALRVRGGGAIISTSILRGRPGNIFVTAETLDFSGVSPGTPSVPSSIFAGSFGANVQAGANINVVAGDLIVADGAGILVQNFGSGVGGDINIVADSIRLNGGSIKTGVRFGEGGNLRVEADELRLEDSSQILAQVGTATNPVSLSSSTGTGGNGGNLTVDADAIVALDNSDIFTETLDDRGGRIRIETDGLFGLQVRENLTSNSDIVPESRVDLDTQKVTSPDINAQENLAELMATIVDPDELLGLNCTSAIPTNGNSLPEATEWEISESGRVTLVTDNSAEPSQNLTVECR